jgi:hypothetical protein
VPEVSFENRTTTMTDDEKITRMLEHEFNIGGKFVSTPGRAWRENLLSLFPEIFHEDGSPRYEGPPYYENPWD